jgi:mannose-1-phosphate guanylyltransferase/mannose-6-phosphate isomerase
MPKQFLPLATEGTLFQDTIGRITDQARFEAPVIVCNDEHRFIAAEQLRAKDLRATAIVAEKTGRDTGPAAAIAALMIATPEPDAVLLVMPADHVIAKPEKFIAALDTALGAAEAGRLVTFGVTPARPETGYGYIRRGEALKGLDGCFALSRFVEKPDAETARAYLKDGGYDWNSGIFLFKASRYLEELDRFQPAITAACRAAIAGGPPGTKTGGTGADFIALDAEAFAAAPAISIDHAVMEPASAGAVVPVDMGWSDLGSFQALWESGSKDGDGNVVIGDGLTADVAKSLVVSQGPLVCVIGLDDVVVVATEDAVLATKMSGDVKSVVERLTAEGRGEPLSHPKVHRPWGSYHVIDSGEGFQVKRITVNPGAKLSLQSHQHRAEHWVVVSGRALVTLGTETITLEENETVDIAIGVLHRLENTGAEPLQLIEIQSGSYLGEDDIVRYDDSYGRE